MKFNKKLFKILANTLAVFGLISLVAFLSGNYTFNLTNDDIDENSKLERRSTIHSQYTGQENRGIKALSRNDTQGLLNGAGTPFGGMAKAAELNGYPGPRHLLDAHKAGELELTSQQKIHIEALFNEMRTNAIKLGTEIVDLEKEIDDIFAKSSVTEELLQKKTSESAILYGQLRFIHLKYHLYMVDILTPEQVTQYNKLRGYASEDPCENAPQGHDEKLWKLHNGC